MEIWRDISGYENLYMVSSYGRIKSLGNGCSNASKERILKQSTNTKGYLHVHLCKNGKDKNFRVHRLVAEAFIPNPNNLPEVNHKDENKQNNFVYINEDGTVDLEKSNIEWCDHTYNVNYGSRTEKTIKKLTNGKHSKQVLQYDLDGNIIAEFSSIMEVERQLGFANNNISKCCKGKYKQAYGYKWQYKNG